MIADNDTIVIYGRYWYDFVTLASVIAFFLIELLLLFRNSIIGWAMTAKCLAVAFVFLYALLNPPVTLPEEEVSVGAALVRIVLIGVLVTVIGVLLWMRWLGATVVVGRPGDLPGREEAAVRDAALDRREGAVAQREIADTERDRVATVREGDVAVREGSVVTREVAVTERESDGLT